MLALADSEPLLQGAYWVQDAGACSGVYVLDEGRTLIDAGNMFGLMDEILDVCPAECVERILLTHAHFDHVGGVEEIYQAADPDLYVHPSTRECLKLLSAPFPEFFDILDRHGKIKLLGDGDVVDGPAALQVIHTPGHTAGDICFLNEVSGALFCGDAVLPHKHPYGPMLSKPDEVCGGLAQDKLESLRKLLALPVRHLFPGHGNPIFHKGSDHIKFALFTLHQSLNVDRPEQAWISMEQDLLLAGLVDDARQCAAVASEMKKRRMKG